MPTTTARKTATSKRTHTKKAGAAAAAPATSSTSAGAAAAAPADVTSDAEYLGEVPLSAILKHPLNPRHRATADEELVESIRTHGVLQPVIVAPHPDKPAKHYLIAGHRRHDGSGKAGRKTIAALLRRDLATEGQQLEAMLVENGRRKDLTPMEEAEGYHQLELFGYKPAAIAKAVGVSRETVQSRLKLLKLAPSTRKRIDAGDLTLADASSLVEFADDPETTKGLERAAKSDPGEFKRALTEARRVRDARQRIAVDVAKLLDRGATEVEISDGQTVHDLRTERVEFLEYTHSDNWDHHQGCLGFVRFESTWQGPQLRLLCLDAQKHAKELAESREAESVERERQYSEAQKAREAESLKRQVAADMRLDTVMAAVADVATPATPVTDVVRYLLPILLHELDEYGDDGRRPAYQRLMGIRDEDRWARVRYSDARKIDKTRFRQHVDEIRDSPAIATRALVAYLAVTADRKLGTEHSVDHTLQVEYLLLLDALGHVGDQAIDDELRQVHLDKGGATS